MLQVVVVTSTSSPPHLLHPSCFRGDQGPALKALDTIVPVATAPMQMPENNKLLPCIALTKPSQGV